MSAIKFLWSLLRHKFFVFVEACRLGIPWLGLIHDWSKFLPSEYVPYARYFYGNYPKRSEIHGDMRNEIPDRLTKEGISAAFDIAWNYHEKRNKHHWQYWVLINDRSEPQVQGLPMPERYIREMVADWRGAGRAYGNPNTVEWYQKQAEKQIMHLKTRRRVEELLGITK
jgi:hypothetical protein